MKPSPNSSLIRRADAGLLIVDVQERLLPAMHGSDCVLRNVVRLACGAEILQIPVLVTEQYPKGIGRTLPDVARAVPGFAPLEKLSFSCCRAPGFLSALTARKVTDVVLCGIEAHVCVLQTALDLLGQGFRVFVVADACSSRAVENYRLGLERMRDCGAVVVSTEMILFELLERAGTGEFKRILDLVK